MTPPNSNLVRISLLLVIIFLLPCDMVQGGLYEPDRVAEYNKRNYTWPPSDEEFIPNTEGWRKIMKRRLEQVRRIESHGDMYNGEFA